MWRIFRGLDRHPPNFYKFTLMVAGLASIVAVSFLLGRIVTAAGIVFGFVTVFALWHASFTYRFKKRESQPPRSTLTIAEADDDEVLRRVRRHEGTEKLRRHILWLAAHDTGKRGDRARGIVEGWKAAGKPEGKPVEPAPETKEQA